MIYLKEYSKPEVNKIVLDSSISLVMMTIPPNPPPRGTQPGGKGINNPGYEEPAFKSPFGDKPFG